MLYDGGDLAGGWKWKWENDQIGKKMGEKKTKKKMVVKLSCLLVTW